MDVKAIAGDVTKVETGALIVNFFEDSKKPEGDCATVDAALDGTISSLIKKGDIKGKLNEITLLHCTGKLAAGRVVVLGLGKKSKLSLDKIRGAVGEVCRNLRGKRIDHIAAVVLGVGVNGIKASDAVQAMAEGAILGLYTFRRHMTKNEDFTDVKEFGIVSRDTAATNEAIERARIISEAVTWARDLVNEPSNFMTPTDLAVAAQKAAAENGIKIEVLEKQQIASLGMGALLGVARGSHESPRFIAMTYKGKKSGVIDMALVGKGITFDSGGIDIKPQEGMHEMKGDMAGAASVLGSLIALARLKAPANVVALVPATENMPGGGAQKPGDVVTAMNGKTIEVLNTDAEGRLILSDALSYATKKLNPKAIIDVATLTGSCRSTLGTICTGVFSNDDALVNKLIASGFEVGEYMWQFPMFEEYDEQIKSDVADIKNLGGKYAGAITAAKFLAEFVDDTPWVHLDIAGTSDTDKDKGYQVKGATGVPVRTLVNLVMKMAKE